MTPEEEAIRNAWLAELWPTVHEVSREDRAAEKALRDVDAQPVDKPRGKRGRRVS